MKFYDNIAVATEEARDWITINKNLLDEPVKTALTPLNSIGTSPVDTIVNFAEKVYANVDLFDEEAKDIAAGCALLAAQYGFHGLNIDNRGALMASVLRDEEVENAPAVRDDLIIQSV